MRSLDEILAISAERKGGADAVLADIVPSKGADELSAIPDDRWLAEMSRSVFQAGFNWKVVDHMWPGFETAFHGFDPGWCAQIEDARFDALLADSAIVRHGAKIRAVAENARFVADKGGFGAWATGFGPDRFAELLLALKGEGARLGGTTGQYFLRAMGVDGWILSRDVSARLVAEGVVEKVTPTKKTLEAVQAAFSTWRAQSGRSLKEISRILATSTG
ncbi:MAG: DNA-3-methyladenine glycosylase I [Pseudomonadota bacterium]